MIFAEFSVLVETVFLEPSSLHLERHDCFQCLTKQPLRLEQIKKVACGLIVAQKVTS